MITGERERLDSGDRDPLDDGLLPHDLLDDALLHVHATASGVTPVDDAMLNAGELARMSV
jgi:hypothetical protein